MPRVSTWAAIHLEISRNRAPLLRGGCSHVELWAQEGVGGPVPKVLIHIMAGGQLTSTQDLGLASRWKAPIRFNVGKAVKIKHRNEPGPALLSIIM